MIIYEGAWTDAVAQACRWWRTSFTRARSVRELARIELGPDEDLVFVMRKKKRIERGEA